MRVFVKSRNEFIDYVKGLVRRFPIFLTEVRDVYEREINNIATYVEEIVKKNFPDLLPHVSVVTQYVHESLENVLYRFSEYTPITYVIPYWKIVVSDEYYVPSLFVLPCFIAVPPEVIINPCEMLTSCVIIDHALIYLTPLTQAYSDRYRLCVLLTQICGAITLGIILNDLCTAMQRGWEPDLPAMHYISSAYQVKLIIEYLLSTLLNIEIETPSSEVLDEIRNVVKEEVPDVKLYEEVIECFQEGMTYDEIKDCLRKKVITPNRGFALSEII